MNWVRDLLDFLVMRSGISEVILLGAQSAQELAAERVALSFSPDERGVLRATHFMGIPIVAARGGDRLLVEVHTRENDQPLIRRIR